MNNCSKLLFFGNAGTVLHAQDSMDSMITSAEGNAFPKEGHGNKIFLFDTLVQFNFKASHRQLSGNLALGTEFTTIFDTNRRAQK